MWSPEEKELITILYSMTDEYSFGYSNELCFVIKEDFSEPNIPITKSHGVLQNTCQTKVEKPSLAKEGAKGL